MKRTILSALLAFSMIFGLMSCSAKEADQPVDSEKTSATEKGESVAGDESKSEEGGESSVSSGNEESSSDEDPSFARFPEPVVVHIGMEVDPTGEMAPGDTYEDNMMIRYHKDKFNIEFVVDWTAATGSDYNQKVNLAIASGSIPDGLVVNNRNYMLKAAQADLLYDITDLWAEYSSEKVQGLINSSGGRAIKNGSYNGRLYSIPSNNVDTDGISVMFIRKDWFDELELEVPETVSEIGEVARAFVENKMAGEDTIGIVGADKNAVLYCDFLNSSNAFGGFDPIFQALDAYPGYWLDNGDGTVTYGSTTENTKKGLEILAGWYEEGLIDPQMGTRNANGDPIVAGQTGIFFGPWWCVGYGIGDAYKNDPTANWQAYPVYTDEGQFYSHMMTTGSQYTIINKNASEDVAKAIIITHNALARDTIEDWGEYYNPDYTTPTPLYNHVAPTDEVIYEYTELTNLLQGNTKLEDYDPNDSVYKWFYTDAETLDIISPPYDFLNITNFDMSGTNGPIFNRLYSILVGARPAATVPLDKAVYSVTYDMTETMETRWANLEKLEDETMLKIILGKADPDTFDQFVNDWKAQGGDKILEEVQDLLE